MLQLLENAVPRFRAGRAFRGHPLHKADDNTTELYFRLLCGAAHEAAGGVRGREFLTRLAAGTGFDGLDECLAKAGNDDFASILRKFDFQELGNSLVIDMILLACSEDVMNEELAGLLGNLFVFYGAEADRARQTAERAAYILSNVDYIDSTDYPLLLGNMVTGDVSVDEEMEYSGNMLFLNCDISFGPEGKMIFTNPDVKFLNCRLEDMNILFEGYGNAVVHNCLIECGRRGAESRMAANGLRSMEFTGCRMRNIVNSNEALLNVDTIDYLTVKDNLFTCCNYMGSKRNVVSAKLSYLDGNNTHSG